MFKLFEKKMAIKPRVYAVVDYSEEAKKNCVGGEENMRIFLFDRMQRLISQEMFSYARVKQLRKQGIPAVIRSDTPIPKECLKEPASYLLLGRVEFEGVIS